MIYLHSNEENHLKVKIGTYPAVDSVVLVSLFPLLESGQIIHCCRRQGHWIAGIQKLVMISQQ